jgi:hypothetical protein
VAANLSNPISASAFLQSLGWKVSWGSTPSDSSSIKLPFLPLHWNSLGQTPWTVSYNLQDVTGTATTFDTWQTVQDVGYSLTPNGFVQYRQILPNWNRTALTFGGEVLSKRVASVGAGLAAICTGSFATLLYSTIKTNAAIRSLHGRGPGATAVLVTRVLAQVGTGGIISVNCSGTTVAGVSDHRDGNVHPTLLVYDNTNQRIKLYSDLEKITGSYFATTAPNAVGIGDISDINSANFDAVYWALMTGSTAELLSDDGRASALLKQLGWNPPW